MILTKPQAAFAVAYGPRDVADVEVYPPTLAQQVEMGCKNATEAMERAHELGGDPDQDWAEESTTYTFADGSRLRLCGPEFDVVR